jgi:hypothetical protein
MHFSFTLEEMLKDLKNKAFHYYEENEAKVDIAFFVAGFLFDILTLSDIDDPLSILQQVIYLTVTGSILYFEFLHPLEKTQVHQKFPKLWHYRDLAFHFLLGSLLSVYSLFFIKSASIFSSILFVIFILGLMIANEVKAIQQGKLNIKLGLYVVCVFSFFSMMFPVMLGFVGLVPFLLSVLMTLLFLWGAYRLLRREVQDDKLLLKELFAPTGTVLGLFLIFYFLGWIPPVPLSIQNMGVYHLIEKKEGQYILHHENPWYKFWNTGDQDFKAEPGDKIYFFAKIFSPGRFSDSVILHWFYKDPKRGWQSADRIPMGITGGRKGGFRGFAIKQNYQEGEWRVSVETTDQREIGRLYFDVTKVSQNPERHFEQIAY